MIENHYFIIVKYSGPFPNSLFLRCGLDLPVLYVIKGKIVGEELNYGRENTNPAGGPGASSSV
jgi:hypothetical protein